MHGYKDTLNSGRDIRPLKSAKLEGESFSDVIDRLLKITKRNLSAYFGVLKDEELLEGLEDSRKIRKLSKFRNDCT